jgi:hypothetical protein
MARIDIRSNGGAALNDGVLQLENGVAMDSTLRNVADQNNTTSPLLLSTTAVQVVSPLRITTDDPSDMYLDCEDGSTNNRFNITRNTASQQVNLNFASNPAGSTTTVGAIRTFTDGVNLGEVVKFREDGQVTFTERVNVEADSLVTTQGSSVIAASTTNANLVITPNGTGALVASIPDGTATGGNARGSRAVDFSLSRLSNTSVASGNNSAILAGYNNRASGSSSSICGGDNNIASNQYTHIGGGTQNTTSGEFSTIAGGFLNTASSNLSTVSGGQSNVASTNTHATVVGGSANTASGLGAISGGLSNTASALGSVAFGFNCVASGGRAMVFSDQSSCSSGYGAILGGSSNSITGGQSGVIIGGTGNFITGGDNGFVTNKNNKSQAQSTSVFGGQINVGRVGGLGYLINQQVVSGDSYSASYGTNQYSILVANREAALTTGTTAVLSLDGTGTTNLIIPEGNNRMWNVQVRWVAVVTTITGTATGVTVGDTKTSTDLLAVAKRAGTTTVSPHTSAGTHAIETIVGSLTGVNIAYTAGASQEMAITFTAPTFSGGGSVTMRVSASISLTEVSY